MPLHARRSFEPSPAAVREARQFVREAISQRPEQPSTTDVELALSELATNAVRHARTPFDVVIETNGVIRVEVEDGSTAPPLLKPSSTTRPGGRGVSIVQGLCDRWGVHIVKDGKCVWCELDWPRAG